MTGRGAEPFSGATLAVTENAAEAELAKACIARQARDAYDARLLLDIVFGETRPMPQRGLKANAAKPKAEPRSKEPRKRRACGTPPAYRRHLANGEEPCQPCRDAIAAVRREARAALRVHEGEAP